MSRAIRSGCGPGRMHGTRCAWPFALLAGGLAALLVLTVPAHAQAPFARDAVAVQDAGSAVNVSPEPVIQRNEQARRDRVRKAVLAVFPWFADCPLVFRPDHAALELPDGRVVVLDGKDHQRVTVFDFKALDPDERALLERSTVAVTTSAGPVPLSGAQLFRWQARYHPLDLLGFLNVTAKLRTPAFNLGRSEATQPALRLVQRIESFARDRLHAVADPQLKEMIAGSRRFSKVAGHGEKYPDSYKQTDRMTGGGQISFSRDGTRIDADIDLFNIAARNPLKKVVGAVGHLGEVVTPGKTDPHRVAGMLAGEGTPPSVRIFASLREAATKLR